MKRVLKAAVRFYQLAISSRLPPSCRYTPTCSQYMLEAIDEHGALKGFFMGVGRVLRCNPFFKGGYDPVPPKKKGGYDPVPPKKIKQNRRSRGGGDLR